MFTPFNALSLYLTGAFVFLFNWGKSCLRKQDCRDMRESFRSILLFLFILGAALILFSAGPVPAGSPLAQKDFSLSGTALAQRVYDRENGDDSLARATMELISKGGRKRVRDHTIS